MTVSQSGNEIAQVSYGAADHLAFLGRNAVAASDGGADSPDLIEFNRIIAAYSLNRGKPIKSESGDNPGHPGVDWRRVEELGEQLAASRCDLKLYAYLALAGFETRRDEGHPYLALAAILAATADIVEQAWERCAPKLPARRQAQLKFLSEELAITVKERPPGAAEAADFLSALSVTERLANSSGRAFGFDYPLLRELREAMKAHAPAAEAAVAAARPLPEPRPAAAPAPAPTAEPVVSERLSEAPSSAAAPAPSPPPVSVAPAPAAVPLEVPAPAAAARESIALPSLDLTGLADKSPDVLEDQLAALVTALTARLRSDSITDPGPYWLLRALRWANHELLQPARTQEVVANKYKTWLPVPQGHKNLLKSIPARLAQGQHAAVVGECEELFATYPMWLDLQRFICQGLDGLGATAAREAVRSQIALLLARCPELPRFKFSDRDGTPLADAETREWLEGQRANPAAGALMMHAPQSSSSVEALPEGLLPGVQFLKQQLGESVSAHRRFELQLRLAEHLLAHERSDVAMPIVELLLAAIDTHRLAEWQPELCARALRVAVRVGREREISEQRLTEMMTKLGQVDAMELITLETRTK